MNQCPLVVAQTTPKLITDDTAVLIKSVSTLTYDLALYSLNNKHETAYRIRVNTLLEGMKFSENITRLNIALMLFDIKLEELETNNN